MIADRLALGYLLQSSDFVPETDDWLGPGERSALARLRVPKRRGDWRLGRWTAKQAIRSVVARSGPPPALAAIEIFAASDGHPETRLRGERAPLAISLSHSGSCSLCLVTAPHLCPGCDLERIEPRDPEFVADYFSEEEIALVSRYPAGTRPIVVTAIWSAKESALKALREGLRRDTRSAIVRIEGGADEGGWRRLRVDCRETSRVFPGWWRVDAPYVLTLVSADPAAQPEPLHLRP